MQGSYIGALVGLGSFPIVGWMLFFVVLQVLGLCDNDPWCMGELEDKNSIGYVVQIILFNFMAIIKAIFPDPFGMLIIMSLPVVILGFIVGWIIHGLIIKYRH